LCIFDFERKKMGGMYARMFLLIWAATSLPQFLMLTVNIAHFIVWNCHKSPPTPQCITHSLKRSEWVSKWGEWCCHKRIELYVGGRGVGVTSSFQWIVQNWQSWAHHSLKSLTCSWTNLNFGSDGTQATSKLTKSKLWAVLSHTQLWFTLTRYIHICTYTIGTVYIRANRCSFRSDQAF
jgi:hypothetical protein